MLKLENVTKYYGTNLAVDNLSFTINNGEIFGLLGVNGAGKTTLYYNELESAKDFGLRINIDEIVSSFGDWKNRKDQIRASKIALKIREKYIKEGKDFNQESTLCGNSILSLFQNFLPGLM